MMKRFLCVALAAWMGLSAFQVWAFEEGQCVRIAQGGRSLMVENSSLATGRPVVAWTETSTASQRWLLETNGRGGFFLKNAYSGLYLGGVSSTISGAAVGQIAQGARASRGVWYLEPVEGEDGKWLLLLGDARTVALAAPDSVADGQGAVLLTVQGAETERIAWQVEVTEAVPDGLTPAVRDDMMDRWCDHYYHEASVGHVIGRGGWWGDAEMFEVVLDALETTGEARYATMFDELYRNFCSRNGTDWSGNDYNDDITWMCIACVRAYLLTGKTEYLTRSKQNFDRMYARADKWGDGTLMWKVGGTGTNACINGPATVCACYLAQALGQESYYTKAARIYAGNRARLYNIDSKGVFNGHVYDSYDINSGSYNRWGSTYNQGTCLGAAVMLYDHFGTEQYRQDADAIMQWTDNSLADANDIIHVCQTVTGDLSGFKGILMRYVRRYAADLDHPEYYGWLARNAFHAWNNRNSDGISMSAWLSKTPENYWFHDGGDFNTDGVGAFTAVSAAFNAHLGVVDKRASSDTIQAETFNFLRGTTLAQQADEDGTPSMGPLQTGHYLGFRNVDFGSRAASHIVLRLYSNRLAGRLRVLADHPEKGTLLCTINLNDLGELFSWHTYEKELSQPITGVHDIYLVPLGMSEGTDMVTVNWFTFASRNTVYSDLTNMGGQHSTPMEGGAGQLALLTDDSPLTEASFSLAGATEKSIRYDAPTPLHLQAYSLFSSLTDGADPTAWRLEGSRDGTEWTLLDEQTDTTFTARGKRLLMPIGSDEAFAHFRLSFTSTQSASELRLGEWQLLGQGILPTDITADGGTLTEGLEALCDKSASSGLTLTQPLNIDYASTGNHVVTAYTLTATEASAAPSSWALYGSNNGRLWTKIDEQTDQKFPFDGSTVACSIPNGTAYVQYRLALTGEGEVSLGEWQMLGHLDFGTFSPELTSIAQITASDGADIAALVDKDGDTYAQLSGENMKWNLRFPMEVRVIGYSVLAADDAQLNPKSVALLGIDGDTETSLSSRTLSFNSRGARITNTISSSKMFDQISFEVRSTAADTAVARLAELEIYGTAFAADGSAILPPVAKVETSSPGLAALEGIDKLTDRVRTTKYRAAFADSLSITFTYAAPQTIDTYALTAAKDEQTRDPADWTLLGSNDSTVWDVLDQRQAQSFLHRYSTHFYPVAEPKAYTHYRLLVTRVADADQLQLCQLQLLTLAAAPTAIGRVGEESLGSLTYSHGQLSVSAPGPAQLSVFDLGGRLRLTRSLPAGSTRADASMLSRGVYVAELRADGFVVRRKILVP